MINCKNVGVVVGFGVLVGWLGFASLFSCKLSNIQVSWEDSFPIENYKH